MTNLKELSDAATQGGWGNVFKETIVNVDTALVNAYRAGRLVEVPERQVPDPRIEVLAKKIYDGFVYDGEGQKPKWVEG